MYRLIVESLLGLHLEVDKLTVTPCLPAEWTSFKLDYRYRDTVYNIVVHQMAGEGEVGMTVDGVEQSKPVIAMIDDREAHLVEISVGARAALVREGIADNTDV